MAKTIKYKFFSAEVNHGTEEKPNIEQIILNAEIICETEAQFNANYSIAEKEAISDTIEIIGEFDIEPEVPTRLDLIESQVTYTAMMTGTLPTNEKEDN